MKLIQHKIIGPSPLIVSPNYRWKEEVGESIFIHETTGQHYPAEEYENKVNVYEDRVKGWFLEVALELAGEKFSAKTYVALSIALSYIEGVQQYRKGVLRSGGVSEKLFKESAARIFSRAEGDTEITRLYSEARCGLFHSSFTDGQTYVCYKGESALEIVGDELRIHPQKFVQVVLIDFDDYLEKLRRGPNTELGKNFLTVWDKRWEDS